MTNATHERKKINGVDSDSHDVLHQRRRRLLRMAGAKSAVILSAAPPAIFSNDVEYPYRQDSDFAYLTGFPEHGAIAVITERQYTLFCLAKDPVAEAWTGARVGPRMAMRDYGADAAFPVAEFDKRVGAALAGADTVYCKLTTPFAMRLLEAVSGGAGWRGAIPALADVAPLTGAMRWRKSAAEIRRMDAAAAISMRAHRRAMRACRPGLYEYEIAAEIECAFMRAGVRTAYPSIVGSGRNACILHYAKNTGRLKDGDMLLIDAACEYAYYASDITRTFPVNGRFTDAQRDLYEVVLEAQLAAIEKATSRHTAADMHRVATLTLTEGLVRLGLLKGSAATLVKRGEHLRFYMHNTGHWLGMDVHDCRGLPAELGEGRLKPGVVLTVEPGLYIPAATDIPKHWRGVGVRIEDDVLVTARGNRVLSGELIKRPEEIETWMAG